VHESGIREAGRWLTAGRRRHAGRSGVVRPYRPQGAGRIAQRCL